MEENNAVLEGKYMDKRFSHWPSPGELNLEELFLERITEGNNKWFYFDKLYSILRNAPKGIVLDLACGPGILSILLAKAGHSVFGVDISEASIKYAKELAHIHNCTDKIDFQVMDVSKLDFASDYFDIITGEDCLHHIIKYNGTVENMYRVLKSGGKGYFWEPFAFNPLINSLRKINTLIKKRDYEKYLTESDLRLLENTFDDVVLSENSVIYTLSRLFSKPVILNKKINIKLKNADNYIQDKFPFSKRFYSLAFLELAKF